MRKRLVAAGIISSLVLSSCQWMEKPQERPGHLHFTIAEPLESVSTRAVSPFDTNHFILTIRSNAGETVYSGEYRDRPNDIEVKSGTYEVSLISEEFTHPAFDTPQYGDSKMIVVSNGEEVNVAFLCKMMNSGIKMTFTGNYCQKFPTGHLAVRQDGGELKFIFTEDRTGYFKASNVQFIHIGDDWSETPLFNRVLGAGELHSITLDASRDGAWSYYTAQVDTSVIRISERVMIGDDHYGENGSTKETAYSVSSAAAHMGDTAWVWGYIVGGDLSTSSIAFEGPFAKSSNIALAESPSERSRDNCFSVELSKASIKSALNLVDNPGILGSKVFIKGVVSTYFGLTGLKNVTDFSIAQ